MSKKIHYYLLVTIGSILPVSYRPFGKIGKKFRNYCVRKIVKSIGKPGNVEKGASVQRDVIIGDKSAVGINVLVPNGVTIGSNVMIAQDVLIYTSGHRFDEEKRKYVGNTDVKRVIIEDDVWIGARSIILPGVTIGKGSTIGAGSIVTKSIPPYSLAAGNPAIVKKSLVNDKTL